MRLCLSCEECGYVLATTIVGNTTGLIYSDLKSPQYVRSTLVLCLNTFIYPSMWSQHVFDNVYYLPVEMRTFKYIRMEILKLLGKPV